MNSKFTESIDRPVLSVIIPTRNRGSVVCRSLESVLRSPRTDLEVVLVDDGSNDDTSSRVSQLVDRRLRFHQINSEGNANRARNIGARLSHGSLLAFLDSDDVFGLNRVERLIGFFSRWPNVDCLVDGYVEISRGTVRTHRMPHSTPSNREIRHMLLAHLIPLTNSAITIRRSAFEAVGGFDEAMPRHQDRELLLRVAQAHSIWFGDDTGVEKHRMASSISHNYDGYIAGLDALVARFADYKLPENSKIFRYLIVRGIVKAIITGHWPAALRELRQWHRAEHLPKDYIRCFRAYRDGARQRSIAQANE